MRPTSLIVAAFLAFAAFLAPGAASAFEFDAQGSSNPDGSAKYLDPDENLNLGDTKGTPTFDQNLPGAPSNSVTLAPGLFLSGSASSNSMIGQTVEGWTNPQPGRLTH